MTQAAKVKTLTLCFITRPGEILLGMKKRGFGTGKWNGFGGKLHEGESIDEALHREVREEVGLAMQSVVKKGFVRFEFQDGTDTHEVHIYECKEFAGAPQETEEMKPQWFPKNALPYKDMWPGDLHWIPTFLSGKMFRGRFVYDRPSGPDQETKILEQQIEKVEKL